MKKIYFRLISDYKYIRYAKLIIKVCLKKNRTASQSYYRFTFLAINTKFTQQIADIHTQKMRYCMLRYIAWEQNYGQKRKKNKIQKKKIFVKNFVKWAWTLLSRCLTIWRKKFTKRMFLDWEVFINSGICNTNHLDINSSQKIEIKSKIQIQSYFFRDIVYIGIR